MGLEIFNDDYPVTDENRVLTAPEEKALFARVVAAREAASHITTSKPDLESEKERLKTIIEDGKRAKEELANANLRIALQVANRYTRRGVPFWDLVQEGNIGLIKAVERFDPERGNRFYTFAVDRVRREIARSIPAQGRAIPFPEPVHRRLVKISYAANGLGIAPDQLTWRDVDRISTFTHIPPPKISPLLKFLPGVSTFDLDTNPHESFGHSPEEEAEKNILTDSLRKAFQVLPSRSQEVLNLRYSKGLSDVQIGKQLGCSRQNVQVIRTNALNKLREALKNYRD